MCFHHDIPLRRYQPAPTRPYHVKSTTCPCLRTIQSRYRWGIYRLTKKKNKPLSTLRLKRCRRSGIRHPRKICASIGRSMPSKRILHTEGSGSKRLNKACLQHCPFGGNCEFGTIHHFHASARASPHQRLPSIHPSHPGPSITKKASIQCQ
jgi:hypothetical protein